MIHFTSYASLLLINMIVGMLRIFKNNQEYKLGTYLKTTIFKLNIVIVIVTIFKFFML